MTKICALISDMEDVSMVVNEVRTTAVALGGDPEAVEDTSLALYEAVVNSSIHGYQRQPGSVEIEIQKQGADLFIFLRDSAPLFDPRSVLVPDVSLPLEARGRGGMGIHMMRHFVDELRYRITATNQNEVILVKKNAFTQEVIQSYD